MGTSADPALPAGEMVFRLISAGVEGRAHFASHTEFFGVSAEHR